MAVNHTRSMNLDLHNGFADGKFKNLTPDRGGNVEVDYVLKRMLSLQEQYGVTNKHELAHYVEVVFDRTLGTR